MTRKVTAVVLCEDKQAATLLYQYLKREREFARDRVLPLPAGAGCGSQFVRERYAQEVRAQRDKSVASVLVVHTDADNQSVAARKQELAEALRHAGLAARGQHEPIALVIPRWETESWLHHFLGRPVVETARYPKFKGNEASAAQPTAKALGGLVDGHTTAPGDLPALAEAAVELRRLP